MQAHRLNDPFDILRAVPEYAQHAIESLHGVRYVPPRSDCAEDYPILLEPFQIGVLCCECRFDFGILQNTTLLGIHHQYFTRAQTSFLSNLRGIESHYSGLGGDDHGRALGDQVACRTQAVSIEHPARVATVRKNDGRRAIPWLHPNTVIFIKTFQLGRKRILVVITLRYEHCQRVRQRHARADEKFQHIVKRRAVAHSLFDDRTDPIYRSQYFGMQ